MIEAHRRESYPTGASLSAAANPHQLTDCCGGVRRLAGGAHQAAADDHAVGARRGGRRRLLRRPDPEPDSDWHLGARPRTCDHVAPGRRRRRSRSPVVPVTETV